MTTGIARIQVERDATKQIEETEEYLMVPTILAREGILTFMENGQKKMGYRPAQELKDAAYTAEGAWIVAEEHVDNVFVMDRKDIRGRVEQTKFCSDINAVIGKSKFFKNLCKPEFLERVRKGEAKDVSIGYFYDSDRTPGKWGDQPYDFVQRNLLIGHLAAGVPQGRCPSPFCGMQVGDALKAMFDPETTANYVRIPVAEGEVTATITLSESEGIKALIGRKDGKSFIITYLFETAKGWTMDKARAWVDSHKGDSIDAAASDAQLQTKILELNAQRKTIMDQLYPAIREDTPERAKMHLDVSIIDEQVTALTKQLAERKAAANDKAAETKAPPKWPTPLPPDPHVALARARELLAGNHENDIRKKSFGSRASH